MTSTSDIHSEVSELLPWYINGTLEKPQLQLVRTHIDGCVECRDDYAFLRSVDAAVNKSSPVPIVPQPQVEELLSRIDKNHEDKPHKKHSAIWAIAASFLVTAIVIAVVLGSRTPTINSQTRFETATSTASTTNMDYVVRIQFQPGTESESHYAIIQALSGRDVIADSETDAYRMIVSVPGTSLEELEAFIQSAESRPAVRSVEIVALQLPVRKDE